MEKYLQILGVTEPRWDRGTPSTEHNRCSVFSEVPGCFGGPAALSICSFLWDYKWTTTESYLSFGILASSVNRNFQFVSKKSHIFLLCLISMMGQNHSGNEEWPLLDHLRHLHNDTPSLFPNELPPLGLPALGWLHVYGAIVSSWKSLASFLALVEWPFHPLI